MASQTARSSNPSPSSGDFNFREVTDFVDWIQIAIENLGKSPQLPPLPSFGQGSVRTWAEAIENFHQQFLQVEKDRDRTQSDLQLAQGKIDNLTQDLEQSSLEAKDAQGACVGLQKEIEKYKELLENLAAVTKERDLLNEQLRVAKGDLDKNCAELDSLSLTLKNISKSILGALPPFP
jgi:DNA repair exonuclease SbcCD ATPase subunit